MLIALLVFAAALWVGLAVTTAVVLGRGIGIADADRHTATFTTPRSRTIRTGAARHHAA